MFAIFVDYDNNYLLRQQHCLYEFIISFVCFILYSFAYPWLMPDIRLPDNIAIRSRYGYAYLGKINQLEIKWQKFSSTKLNGNSILMEYFATQESKTNDTYSIDREIEKLNGDMGSSTADGWLIFNFVRGNAVRWQLDSIKEFKHSHEETFTMKEGSFLLGLIEEKKQKFDFQLITNADALMQLPSWNKFKNEYVSTRNEIKQILQNLAEKKESAKEQEIAEIYNDYPNGEQAMLTILDNGDHYGKTQIAEIQTLYLPNGEQNLNIIDNFGKLYNLASNKLNQWDSDKNSTNNVFQQFIKLQEIKYIVDKFTKDLKNIRALFGSTRKKLEDLLLKYEKAKKSIEQLERKKIELRQIVRERKDNLKQHYQTISMDNFENVEEMMNEIKAIKNNVTSSRDDVMYDFNQIDEFVANMIDRFWGRSIYYARENNQLETVEWLLNHGAKEKPKNTNKAASMHMNSKVVSRNGNRNDDDDEKRKDSNESKDTNSTNLTADISTDNDEDRSRIFNRFDQFDKYKLLLQSDPEAYA